MKRKTFLIAFSLIVLVPIKIGTSCLLLIQKYRYDNKRSLFTNSHFQDVNKNSLEVYFGKREVIKSQCYDSFNKAGDSDTLYERLHSSGTSLLLKGNYSEALKFYLDALKISELHKDTISICRTMNNIGVLMAKNQKYDDAKYYYTMALNMYNKKRNKDGIAASYNNLGNALKNCDSIPKALKYYQKALEIRKQLGDSLYVAYCYGNIGNIYIEQEKYKKAEEYYIKALKIFQETGNSSALARTYFNISIILIERRENKKAIDMLSLGLNISKRIQDKELLALYYEKMSETYCYIGSYKTAYEWMIRFQNLKDSIINFESLQQINEMKIKYQTDSKSHQIELLSKEHELSLLRQAALEKKSRNQMIISVLILFVLLIFTYFMFYTYRQAEKSRIDREKLNSQSRLLKAIVKIQETERDRFAKDLHDGLGQYLTALKMNMLSLEPRLEIPYHKREIIYARIISLFDDMYAELRNIAFNIMPQVLSQKGLIISVEELASRINQTGKIKMDIYKYGMDNRLTEEYEFAIFRVIQEITNNAIKHSGSTLISVTFTKFFNSLNIIIETNGVGFNKEVLLKTEGKGWKNIVSRLEILKGTIEIDSNVLATNNSFIIDIPL